MPFTESIYRQMGGSFVLPPGEMARREDRVRAFLFDWDGVFNDGGKGSDRHSGFCEADSMGTNMIRFGCWLREGRMPITAIITGADNRSAIDFAVREHFHTVYSGFSDKRKAYEHLLSENGLESEETAFFFDDILDLPVAERCGLRMLIRRKASPAFSRYVQKNAWCDYITGNEGGRHAVREACDLLLDLGGRLEEVILERMRFGEGFQTYASERKKVRTRLYSWQSSAIVETTV